MLLQHVQAPPSLIVTTWLSIQERFFRLAMRSHPGPALRAIVNQALLQYLFSFEYLVRESLPQVRAAVAQLCSMDLSPLPATVALDVWRNSVVGLGLDELLLGCAALLECEGAAAVIVRVATSLSAELRKLTEMCQQHSLLPAHVLHTALCAADPVLSGAVESQPPTQSEWQFTFGERGSGSQHTAHAPGARAFVVRSVQPPVNLNPTAQRLTLRTDQEVVHASGPPGGPAFPLPLVMRGRDALTLLFDAGGLHTERFTVQVVALQPDDIMLPWCLHLELTLELLLGQALKQSVQVNAKPIKSEDAIISPTPVLRSRRPSDVPTIMVDAATPGSAPPAGTVFKFDAAVPDTARGVSQQDAAMAKLIRSDIWSQLLRGGLHRTEFTRSLSGNHAVDVASPDVAQLEQDLLDDTGWGTTLISQCMAAAPGPALTYGGPLIHAIVRTAFAAILHHFPAAFPELLEYLEHVSLERRASGSDGVGLQAGGGLGRRSLSHDRMPSTLHMTVSNSGTAVALQPPPLVLAAFREAQNLRLKLIRRRQELRGRMSSSTPRASTDSTSEAPTGLPPPTLDRPEPAEEFLQECLRRGELLLFVTAVSSGGPGTSPQDVSSANDQLRRVASNVLEFVMQEDAPSLLSVRRLLNDRSDLAQSRASHLQLLHARISQLQSDRVKLLLFLHGVSKGRDLFFGKQAYHYAEDLDGCGIALENEVRSACYQLLESLVETNFATDLWLPHVVLPLLQVEWRPQDLSFIMQSKLLGALVALAAAGQSAKQDDAALQLAAEQAAVLVGNMVLLALQYLKAPTHAAVYVPAALAFVQQALSALEQPEHCGDSWSLRLRVLAVVRQHARALAGRESVAAELIGSLLQLAQVPAQPTAHRAALLCLDGFLAATDEPSADDGIIEALVAMGERFWAQGLTQCVWNVAESVLALLQLHAWAGRTRRVLLACLTANAAPGRTIMALAGMARMQPYLRAGVSCQLLDDSGGDAHVLLACWPGLFAAQVLQVNRPAEFQLKPLHVLDFGVVTALDCDELEQIVQLVLDLLPTAAAPVRVVALQFLAYVLGDDRVTQRVAAVVQAHSMHAQITQLAQQPSMMAEGIARQHAELWYLCHQPDLLANTQLGHVAQPMFQCDTRFVLRVRARPEVDAPVVGMLYSGEWTHVLDVRGRWCRLQLRDHWRAHSDTGEAWAQRVVADPQQVHYILLLPQRWRHLGLGNPVSTGPCNERLPPEPEAAVPTTGPSGMLGLFDWSPVAGTEAKYLAVRALVCT